jgi:hypothetical protein
MKRKSNRLTKPLGFLDFQNSVLKCFRHCRKDRAPLPWGYPPAKFSRGSPRRSGVNFSMYPIPRPMVLAILVQIYFSRAIGNLLVQQLANRAKIF